MFHKKRAIFLVFSKKVLSLRIICTCAYMRSQREHIREAKKYKQTMSKKDNNDITIIDDLGLSPEILDQKHQVIPIVTGGDDDTIEEVQLPEILPILTLRSSVLFPGAITPITVGREKSIALVRAVQAENGLLGAVLQRNAEIETPTPDDMYRIGTAARILKILEMPNGNLTVILSGLEKIEVGEYISTEPFFKAKVTPLLDSTPERNSVEFDALIESLPFCSLIYSLLVVNTYGSCPRESVLSHHS